MTASAKPRTHCSCSTIRASGSEQRCRSRLQENVPGDTIVVHGEEDDVVPLADVFDWARPQQLPIIVFPGCGHFFHGRLPQLSGVVTSLWRHDGATGSRR